MYLLGHVQSVHAIKNSNIITYMHPINHEIYLRKYSERKNVTANNNFCQDKSKKERFLNDVIYYIINHIYVNIV